MQQGNDFKSSRIRPHTVQIDNRERATITAVLDVDNFNEEEISVVTEAGALIIAGRGLHITRLNLEEGLLSLEGEISEIEYAEVPAKRAGLFSLFR